MYWGLIQLLKDEQNLTDLYNYQKDRDLKVETHFKNFSKWLLSTILSFLDQKWRRLFIRILDRFSFDNIRQMLEKDKELTLYYCRKKIYEFFDSYKKYDIQDTDPFNSLEEVVEQILVKNYMVEEIFEKFSYSKIISLNNIGDQELKKQMDIMYVFVTVSGFPTIRSILYDSLFK